MKVNFSSVFAKEFEENDAIVATSLIRKLHK